MGGRVWFLGLSIRSFWRLSSLKKASGCSWLPPSAEFGFSGSVVSMGRGDAGSHSFRVSLNPNTGSLPMIGSQVFTLTLDKGDPNVNGLILVEWLESLTSSESSVVFCPFLRCEDTLFSVVWIIGKFFGLRLAIYRSWLLETVSKLVVFTLSVKGCSLRC